MIDVFHDAAARPQGVEFRHVQRYRWFARMTHALGRWGTLRPIGCASAIVGVVIGARAAEPNVLTTLGTAELLGIVMLVLGPVLTLLALRFDRRCAAQSKPSPTLTTNAVRTTTHEAHTRSIPVPTRASDLASELRSPEQVL